MGVVAASAELFSSIANPTKRLLNNSVRLGLARARRHRRFIDLSPGKAGDSTNRKYWTGTWLEVTSHFTHPLRRPVSK